MLKLNVSILLIITFAEEDHLSGLVIVLILFQ